MTAIKNIGRMPATLTNPASDAEGGVAEVAQDIKQGVDAFVDGAGKAMGYAELLGLRYPVPAYQSQVSNTLTRGSRLDAQGMADIKAQGFKSVVNLCMENNDDAAPAQQLGLNALHVPVLDNSAPTEDQVKTFLDFVTNPANEPAYVHCEAGRGRTGVMTACYRMAVEGWPMDKALAEAQSFGMVMPGQIQFVERFGSDLAAGKIPGYPQA